MMHVEPCQFILSDGAIRFGILTDTGSYTDAMLEQLNGLQGLMIECNYETEMLRRGPYPYAFESSARESLWAFIESTSR